MKLKKFNELNEGITPKYLLDYMEEVEEDPICDGPFSLTKEQWKEFADNLNDKTKNVIMEWHSEDSWENVDYHFINLMDEDKEVDNDILNCFCDIINKYNIKEPKGYGN